MSFIELDRDEYLESVQKIGDFDTLKFSKHALDWWDDYYSWKKFPPIALSMDGINKAYIFYHISKDNRYLTIHNLFTPKAYREKGFAHKLLAELFSIKSGEEIDRFKMFCVSSSLKFYNSIGLKYWGVNNLNQYYCDFKMPKENMSEIRQIVKDSSVSEFTDIEYDKIYETLKDNGSEFDSKEKAIYDEVVKKLDKKFLFDTFLKR
jgi:hypothetical protein